MDTSQRMLPWGRSPSTPGKEARGAVRDWSPAALTRVCGTVRFSLNQLAYSPTLSSPALSVPLTVGLSRWTEWRYKLQREELQRYRCPTASPFKKETGPGSPRTRYS